MIALNDRIGANFAALCFSLLLLVGCGKEPQTIEELKSAGQTAFVNEDFATAREYLGKAVKINTSDRDILYFLGISYQRDYLYDSAMHYLKRADLLFPNDRETNLELYKVCLALDEYKNAIKAISVLVATGDKIEDYYSQLAELQLKDENYLWAYFYLSKLEDRAPENPNWYLQYANVAAQIDSLEIAVATMNKAIELFGEKEELLINKGLYLTARKKFDEGEAIFRKLVARDTSSVPYRLNLANNLGTQDSRKKKLEAYNLYKEISPLIADDRFRIDSLISVLAEELNLN